MESNKIRKEPKQCCTTRGVLWYLIFLGFAVNYMIRLNLNLAIVSMVRPKPTSKTSLTSECLQNDKIVSPMNVVSPTSNNSTLDVKENLNFTLNTVINEHNSTESTQQYFDWNEKEQGYILGSFFWLHWCTQIPGGMLASKYGTKSVFGWSNFLGVFINFVIPWFAHRGALYLIFIRGIQGFLTGFCWPSMHNMIGKWVPPNERSKFVSAYMGSSVGAGLTYPLFGFIIQRWGWELVFYSSGILGSLWGLAWWLLVYDSPAEHPRITQEEKNYIVDSLGKSVSDTQLPVPWKAILKDVHGWATVIAQVGSNWGLFTLTSNGPGYFKFIHGWDIQSTGLLSGIPHFFRIIFAYGFSLFGDYLLRTEKLGRPKVRKLATLFANGVQGVFTLGLAYSGCDSLTGIVMFTAAIAVNGAVSTGALAGLVDRSPNHSAILLGFTNTAVALVGFVTPLVVGYFTFQNQTTVQWQKVFWVCTALLTSTCIVYGLFSKSEVASWNSPKATAAPETEMMVVKKNKEKDEKDEKNAKHKIVYSDESCY